MRTVTLVAGLLIRDGLTERIFSQPVSHFLVYVLFACIIMDITDFYRGKK